MYKLPSSSSFVSRLVCGVLAAVCIGFLFAQAADAQTTYVNNQNLQYFVPGPPTFNQLPYTGFDNENVYSVTYNNFFNNQVEVCEPWIGTLFFTNNGEMMVNAPFPTNGDFNTLTPGVAYEFDTEEGNSNVMAGTFYNPGIIHCDSVLDGNNGLSVFFIEDGIIDETLTSIGDCFVTATNIINPGNIVVGEGGQLNLNGQNVDLTRSVLTLEQGVANSNNVDVAVTSEGEGYDTNQDWNPVADLGADFAFSSFPDDLFLSPSTSYFSQVNTGPTNVLVRAVFIENANTNISANVYIAPAAFGNDGALIQWSGTYPDPATGLTDTNYLYLFHYYFNSTNFLPILEVGVPPNLAFENAFSYLWAQQTPNQTLGTPTPAGFENIFSPDNAITNIYEYFNSSLTGTTVGTNASGANPSGALTNMPNRIVINASHELKMGLAQISGQNYTSLTATNQFDGSPGALISSPYSDINLGVTNGYPLPLTISNLLAVTIPTWGGTLNEWSTRWTNVDANGINWDFRVMLVYANLVPAITPQIQSLRLTATNLVISDELNVFGSMFANAQILTLTTNVFGGGATSPEGELNMQQEVPSSWNWNTSFPYLSLLTNNGAILMPNYANFTSSAAVTNAVATIPAVSATNILIESSGKNVASGSTVNIGGNQAPSYTFTTAISKSTPAYYVLIGPNFDSSLTNLISAINAGKGAGTVYSTGTEPNASATAGLLLTNVPVPGITNHGFVVTATIPGTNPGNSIPTSVTGTNLVWTNSASGLYLAGGANQIIGSTNIVYSSAPYAAIINNGLMFDQGATVWVTNFMNGDVVSNGTGSFLLSSSTTTLTNGLLAAGGDISLGANTLVVSNLTLQAGRSLTLQVTNFLTDSSVSNGSIWNVGVSNTTGFNTLGLELPFLPTNTTPGVNNLLGTTVSMETPGPNKEVNSEWAGLDYGASTLGYNTNNVAIGQLILTSDANGSDFYFSGPPGSTTSNAIYVDRLVLENYAGLAYPNWQGLGGVPTLNFNNNPNAGKLTIYYADAVSSSTLTGGPLQDVSYILNGLNGGHLVWVPQYTGYFSSTNMVYPNGTTNLLNIGLATSPFLDSNGNGTPNASDPDPVFARSQLNFQNLGVVNGSNELVWDSPPGATNYLLYCTTNFANWSIMPVLTNSSTVPPPGGWPITNLLYVQTNANSGSYRIKVIQDNSILYGQ